MSGAAIKVENLTKVYKLYNKPVDRLIETLHPLRKKLHQDFYALNNVSFEVGKGEIFGVAGKNGSGKSTLLKIISGVLTPTVGRVELNGKVSAILELGAGFNPEYTGIENIFLNGAILGYTKREMNLKLDEILSFADIGDFVFQPVKTYSSGMLMRLAFSVAITVDPDILIVDEALSVGDALFQRKCFARINSFIEGGKTVLFVSHDLDTMTQICNRALLMDAGEIILDAKPKLIRNYYFKLLYSSPEEYKVIREEIKSINRDVEYKKNQEKELLKITEVTNLVDPINDGKIIETGANKKDFYLPEFVSKSRVETKNYEVDIYDICIKNLNNQVVNYINTNEQYIYSYKVKFYVHAQKVSFGMMFKTTTGFQISGAEAPGKYPFKYIDQVKPGDEFLVDWHFKCNLLPGTYYTNVGVVGSVGNNQRDYLNRILDAYVFNVQNVPNSKYNGLVHLEQYTEIKKVSG